MSLEPVAPDERLLGLSEAEAAQRLRTEGRNVLERAPRRGVALQVLGRFTNPLIVMLLVAAAFGGATGDLASASIIVVIVLFSVSLDFVQEHRAGRAADRLRRYASLRARVVRDGDTRQILAEEVVRGDVITFAPGDLVPADATVLEAHALFVNEALLTGEPYPAEKSAARGLPDGHVDARGTVYMGTSVISGSGSVLVMQTGPATELGKIGHTLSRRAPPTAFEAGSRSFSLFILRVALLLVLFVLLVNLVRGRPYLESFLFATALAVGLTPELLPMVVSVTLSRGALRMARKKVIVKRLAAIHDLGSMDVLCTDKTGTLTEAHIRLVKTLSPQGAESGRVLELAYLNSALGSGPRNPMDEAILARSGIDMGQWTKADEVPFDFERRRVSVLAAKRDVRILVTKGGVEDALALSSRYEGSAPDDLRPLDAPARSAIAERYRALGDEGYRVLGVAWKAEPLDRANASPADEADLTFAGLAVFEDPPKAGAGKVIAALAAAGVDVAVVTGDDARVTQHVCRELGVAVRGVLLGSELQALDDHALAARIAGVNLFCRMTPGQKNRVILAFKQRGHTVGYLGDGINDAPSLQAADVGLSVDGAVDVAKKAADLILLQHDLDVIREGIVEGRRTLGNIVKYVLMVTSSNFGNMVSMAAASVFLAFLPLRPVQVLANNLLFDLSELPIPTDSVDEEFLTRPHRWDLNLIRGFMTVVGPVSSLFDFATFAILLRLFEGNERLFQTGWFVESLVTQVLVIFVIRTRGVAFRSRPSRPLVLVALTVAAVAVLLPNTPLGAALGFVPLPAKYFAVLAPLVSLYLGAVEVVKRWFYKRLAPP
ncbi:MAG: magnesium-translocating P-type ATPase [Trueperaceae bacterium]